jgi:hypothetical protein
MAMAEPSEPSVFPAPGAPAGRAPLFYERPELLTADRYRGKSLAPGVPLHFAKKTNSVPLNGVEFAPALRHYPIVFSEEAAPFPMAILGLRDVENLFVDAAGRWEEGAYVPAYVRRYPFIFMSGLDQKQFALCVDAASAFVVAGDANPFFRDGQPSEATRNALAFCSSFQLEYEKTRAFAAALAEHKLLESKTADIGLKDGRKLIFGSFKLVDEAKLAALPNAVVADWLRRGWLAWIHAHLLSFANWGQLANRLQAPPRGAGDPT